MGYVRPTIKLVFDEDTGDMAGLEVRLRRPSIDQALQVTSLDHLTSKSGSLTTDDRATIDEIFNTLGPLLIGWNLEEEDGTSVPATAEELRKQDVGFVLALIGEWMKASVGVSVPLGRRSTGGSQSEALSIPMDVLSESPAS
jgi:hypothetical protein